MKIFLLFLSVLLPLQEESDVLRSRAAELLELVQKNSTTKALAYVDEESKDRFLELWGKGIPAYKIGDVYVNGDAGEVLTTIRRNFPVELSADPLWIDVPLTMNWVRKNGEWLLHIPEFDRSKTPFGSPFVLPPPPPPPPAGAQTGNEKQQQ